MQKSNPEIVQEKPSRSVRSQRRPQLSREKIVIAAIQIADERGEHELSMPKLARHLGAGTMSLYRHVENRADLLQGMLDHVALNIVHPESCDNPIDEVVVVFSVLQTTMVDKPWIVPILAGCEGYSRHIFDLLDRIQNGLRGMGLSTHETKAYYDMLLDYAYGSALSAHGKANYALKDPVADGAHSLMSNSRISTACKADDILVSSISSYREMVKAILEARANTA